MDYKKKWWRHSVIGVTQFGLGINFIGEAIIIKSNSPAEFYLGHAALWFWIGLFGLVSINAGISFVSDAVKQQIYMELESGEALVSRDSWLMVLSDSISCHFLNRQPALKGCPRYNCSVQTSI